MAALSRDGGQGGSEELVSDGDAAETAAYDDNVMDFLGFGHFWVRVCSHTETGSIYDSDLPQYTEYDLLFPFFLLEFAFIYL